MKVVDTGDLTRSGLGRDQCGEEQGGQNGDDADHHQQLDQTERSLGLLFQPVRSKAQGVPGAGERLRGRISIRKVGNGGASARREFLRKIIWNKWNSYVIGRV